MNNIFKNQMETIGKALQLAGEKDPINELADSWYSFGLRDRDINFYTLCQICSDVYIVKFRNRLRDLELGFKKIGQK
jgi:hypothetical protein